jgi:hypothetical protein
MENCAFPDFVNGGGGVRAFTIDIPSQNHGIRAVAIAAGEMSPSVSFIVLHSS